MTTPTRSNAGSLRIDAAVAAFVFSITPLELRLLPHVALGRKDDQLVPQTNVPRLSGQHVDRVVLLVTGKPLSHWNLRVSGDVQIGEPEHVHDVPVGAVLEYADSESSNLLLPH